MKKAAVNTSSPLIRKKFTLTADEERFLIRRLKSVIFDLEGDLEYKAEKGRKITAEDRQEPELARNLLIRLKAHRKNVGMTEAYHRNIARL